MRRSFISALPIILSLSLCLSCGPSPPSPYEGMVIIHAIVGNIQASYDTTGSTKYSIAEMTLERQGEYAPTPPITNATVIFIIPSTDTFKVDSVSGGTYVLDEKSDTNFHLCEGDTCRVYIEISEYENFTYKLTIPDYHPRIVEPCFGDTFRYECCTRTSVKWTYDEVGVSPDIQCMKGDFGRRYPSGDSTSILLPKLEEAKTIRVELWGGGVGIRCEGSDEEHPYSTILGANGSFAEFVCCPEPDSAMDSIGR